MTYRDLPGPTGTYRRDGTTGAEIAPGGFGTEDGSGLEEGGGYRRSIMLSMDLTDQLVTQGLDALPELLRVVINEAMRLERAQIRRICGI